LISTNIGNARAWRDTFGEQLPDLEIRISPDAGNLADIEYFAFMHPDFDSLRSDDVAALAGFERRIEPRRITFLSS
jgi:hypothetical protein